MPAPRRAMYSVAQHVRKHDNVYGSWCLVTILTIAHCFDHKSNWIHIWSTSTSGFINLSLLYTSNAGRDPQTTKTQWGTIPTSLIPWSPPLKRCTTKQSFPHPSLSLRAPICSPYSMAWAASLPPSPSKTSKPRCAHQFSRTNHTLGTACAPRRNRCIKCRRRWARCVPSSRRIKRWRVVSDITTIAIHCHLHRTAPLLSKTAVVATCTA